MSRLRLIRLITASVALVLGVTLLAAAPANAGNPTGVAAGSPANGAGYLGLRLSTAADGRIKVSWDRPRSARRFVLRVAPNRLMDSKVHSYRFSRRRHGAVVPRAFNATTSSGNFSFVKLYVVRRDGSHGSSLTKWIQAPVVASCRTGQPTATVGTFNVRSWDADIKDHNTQYDWNVRGPHVAEQILASGAKAVAIQEASGHADHGFGPLSQSEWILDRLNRDDPSAAWRDANPKDAYQGKGLVGTRVYYDATRFEKLDAGFSKLTAPQAPTAYAPWVRLRATSGDQTPFVLVATHLSGKLAPRDEQASQVVDVVQQLRKRFDNQVILGGDMNSTVNTKPYDTVQRRYLLAGFYDSFASHSIANSKYSTTNNFHFPVRPTPSRRDFLMTSGVLGSCSYVNRVYTTAAAVASDHFMQVATLPIAP